MGKISNYTRVLKAKLQDVFVVDQTDNNVTTTKSVTVKQIGDTIAGTQVHSDLKTDSQTIIGGINENKDNIGSLSSLTTTDKSSIVGAVNEVNRQLTDYVKVKYFALNASDVTRNMDISSKLVIDSGYKFLTYMPTILPDGFTTDQYLWLSAPQSKQGYPWWNTNPIAGAGTGAKMRFFYLEIRDV